MKGFCSACAKPLKDLMAMKGGKPTRVQVCKSPICRLYNKEQ